MKTTNKTKNIIFLHKIGFSTYMIGKLLNLKKNSVLKLLQYHKVLKPALGRDIEEEVCKWLEKKGFSIQRQRGDAPFDILVRGKRIDVKSAHKTKNGKYSVGYSFQVQSMTTKTYEKDIQKEIDSYYLVFDDEKGRPIYKLDTSNVFVKQTISITHLDNTKYPIQFLGYLDKGVNL